MPESNLEETALECAPRAIDGLQVRSVGSEALAYDPSCGKVRVLDAMGTRVLTGCTGTATLASIVDDIVTATGADRARVAGDVLAIVEQFRAQGLIS
jgi:Coenzyme PQQ synthesis protein D (PqqD)